jgi:hypothetical protein
LPPRKESNRIGGKEDGMEDLRIKVRLAPVSKIALNGKPST